MSFLGFVQIYLVTFFMVSCGGSFLREVFAFVCFASLVWLIQVNCEGMDDMGSGDSIDVNLASIWHYKFAF